MNLSTIKAAETNTFARECDNVEEDDSVCCGCCDELVQALSIAWNELKVGFNKLFSFSQPAQPDSQKMRDREHSKVDLLKGLSSIDKKIELTSRELQRLSVANLFTSLNDGNESNSRLTVLATIKVLKDETQPKGNSRPPGAESINREFEKLKTAKKSQQGEVLNKLSLKEEQLSSLKAEREKLIRNLNELTGSFDSRQKALD